MKKLSLLVVILVVLSVYLHAQNVPFPHHTNYKTHIKPEVEQTVLDSNTSDFYTSWKKKYLVSGCNSGEYKIDYDNGQTVSEAHGYGMMIAVYMAGFDVDAKAYFDGMYKYFRNHPSSITPDLMAWKQSSSCVDVDGNDSASDGDIDIAFSLLLANKQWGSAGEINYLYEAKKIISSIMMADVNKSQFNILYGDWVNSSNNTYYNATRSSDFIFDHFRSFDKVSTTSNWDKVIDKCYDIIDEIQTNYSSATGLMPDFMVDTNTSVKPAPMNHLEGENDGNYYYNACRFPWRIATDYLISGDDRAKRTLDKVNVWITTKTNNIPSKIRNGYKLDGTPIASWVDAAFVAPFAVSAMVNSDNQIWLNDIYSNLNTININDQGYYENTIQLLSYLVISGNYWTPETITLAINDEELIDFNLYPIPNIGGKLYFDFRTRSMSIDKVIAINMVGQVINLHFSENIIFTNQLSQGNYVIKVFTNSDISFSKSIFVE